MAVAFLKPTLRDDFVSCSNFMKIGIILPTRGDRPRFIKNCLRQIETQTLQPTAVALMDYEPESIKKDITQRYRRGYDRLRGWDLDIIALWEDDDYYAPNYLETITTSWDKAGRPNLFGTCYTWYYNLRMKAWHIMEHHNASHAMSTLIKPDLDFPWCQDNEAFTDVHLWHLHTHLQGKVFKPEKIICMGMKHGVGLTGGNSHRENDMRYKDKDANGDWLRLHLTKESFDFYWNYF